MNCFFEGRWLAYGEAHALEAVERSMVPFAGGRSRAMMVMSWPLERRMLAVARPVMLGCRLVCIYMSLQASSSRRVDIGNVMGVEKWWLLKAEAPERGLTQHPGL